MDLSTLFFNKRRGAKVLGENRRQFNVIPFPVERRLSSVTEREPILLLSNPQKFLGKCLETLQSIPVFDVSTANSWKELHSKVLFHRPRVIFLDSQIDWADPLEVIRDLSHSDETPIILLISQKKQTHMLKAAYQAGISDVLFAPYRREDILEALSVLLKLHVSKSLHK